LRTAKKNEEFFAIGSSQAEKTKNEEVVYADPEKITCRYWNYKDCDQTKITESTKEFLFMLDIAPDVPDNLDEAMAMLQSVVRELGASEIGIAVLDKEKREVEL
jgi:DNA/RNA-binding domain of Phe-tRNA-synthetase-like protein